MSGPVDLGEMRRLVEAIDDDTRALTVEEHIEVIRAVPVLLAEVERLRAERDRAADRIAALCIDYDGDYRTPWRLIEDLRRIVADLRDGAR